MPCWELFDEQDQEYQEPHQNETALAVFEKPFVLLAAFGTVGSQESVLLSNYTDVLSIYVEKAATKNTGHDKYAQCLYDIFGTSRRLMD